MTPLEPDQQYHTNDGDDLPVHLIKAYLQEPGEEPKLAEMGTWCPMCEFTESPVAVRMHLEAMMRQQIGPPRKVYALLLKRTGIEVPEVEELLASHFGASAT